MKKYQVKVKSWNRFLIRNLAVKPEIMGNEHSFPFENSTVSIKIPSIVQADRGKNHDEVASVGARLASNNEPLEFRIYKVDVEVLLPITVSLPKEVLNRNPNALDLLSNEKQKEFEKVAKQHQLVAEKAFEYWIRIVRWVCDDSRIGRNQVESFHSGWSTYLKDAESNVKFWIQGKVFYALGYKALGVDKWSEIQRKLSKGSQPPIYVEFKHDAEEHIKLGDYGRSLVDMAIACETFLRFTVLQRLPEELDSKLSSYIEEANISQYINNFFPEVIDEVTDRQFKKLKSDLFSLFERRNNLVHMGKDNGIDEKLCLKFFKVTQKLLSMSGK